MRLYCSCRGSAVSIDCFREDRMKVAVFYHSVTGNTAKVAGAMARRLGTEAHEVKEYEGEVGADLLFLGGAVYATCDHGLDPVLKDFIARLDPSSVGKAVLFKTGFDSDAIPRMKALVEGRGIKVYPESFSCPGRFLFFRLGHPNGADCSRAADFAARVGGVA